MGKLLVVGSSNTDMIIQVPHIPAPGETVLGGEFTTAPGGKGANQAVAAARMGGDVSLVACVGGDMFGQQALEGFKREGIDTRHCVVDEHAPSGVAQIFVADDGENSIAVASGANARLHPRHIAAADKALTAAAVVLVQLETPVETVLEVAHRARSADACVMLNPAPACGLPLEIYSLLDVITPNESEAELLTGVTVTDEESARAAAAVLHDRGVATVLLTRSARGVYMSQRRSDGTIHATSLPAFPVKALDTTAAGDVFNGSLAVGLTEGQPLEEAIEVAQAAAAISVQTLGAQTSAPSRAMVDEFLQQP